MEAWTEACKGYTTLFRQTLFRQTLFRQSTVGTSGGWLQLNRPTGSTDWKDMEPNPKNQRQYNCVGALEVRCNFSGGGGTPDPTRIPSTGPTPLGHLGASINAVLLMHATPRPLQFSPNFYYFYICLSALKMYWVVLTADCRNSICRHRVCRNSMVYPKSTFCASDFSHCCISINQSIHQSISDF